MSFDLNYVRLKATATVQLLKVSATYVALSAANVTATIINLRGISGEFIKTLRVSNLAQTLERFVVSVGKTLTDTAGISEAFRISVGRQASDSASATDAVSKTAGKNLSENAIPSDTIVWLLGAAYGDAATLSDAAIKGVVKIVNDPATASDQLSKSLSKNLNDIVNLSDLINVGQLQVSNDDTGSVVDLAVKSVGKPLVDISTVNAVGYLRGQDYCDFTYFAEDYVGYSQTF